MTHIEKAVQFACHDAQLIGVIGQPAESTQDNKSKGVLFIVGGPQYRAGSHRQFTLMSRALNDLGFATMRFDYRGMGDSDGEYLGFERIDDDIRAAIDCFFHQCPNLKEVTLWGLCDGASAALLYSHQDKRVSGVTLVNPWVRTEESIAKVYLKHYYLQRLLQVSFWKKILRGGFRYAESLQSLITLWRTAKGQPAKAISTNLSLPDRMLQGLRLFSGKVQVVLCENDLTAQEFAGLITSSSVWRQTIAEKEVTQYRLPLANHTFSQRVWRDQMISWTHSWLNSW